MAEFEFGGMTFKGGKMFAILTALSTAGGGLWGGFEFYKDYMDMKEIIANIDIQEIQSANVLQLQKLDDAIAYTVAIREDLAGDVNRAENAVRQLESQVQRAEETVRTLRNDVYAKLDAFEERLRATLTENQSVMADLRDRISTNMEDSEGRIKNTQASIGDTLEGVRTEMNQLQKDITASIREVEGSIRQTDRDLQTDLKTLERNLLERVQEALDNPLSR
jgi:uncharacterized phage infection (PIP) family protein YhgE